MKQYHITHLNDCRLSIGPAPNIAEIALLKKEEKVALVSVLTDTEIEQLRLTEAPTICQELGIDFFHLPVLDTSIPTYRKFVDFIALLYAEIDTYKHIHIHCRYGIGRSATIALGLMIRHGIGYASALEMGTKARKIQVPQSDSQHKLLQTYAKQMITNSSL
jgi:protein-tyrosine phosphatase